MADTLRTYATLLADLFRSGQARNSINAQDLRDLIVSVGSGYQEFSTSSFSEYLTSGLTFKAGGANEPIFTAFRGAIEAAAFPSNKMTEGFFQVHVLHDFKKDTDPTFHIHWGHDNIAPSGNVKWQIEYSCAKGYGEEAYPVSTTLTTTQAAPAQYIHAITDDDDMVLDGSALGLEPDSIIIARVFRDPLDGADTFDDNAFLFHVDLHYERSRQGTLERNRPFTSGGF